MITGSRIDRIEADRVGEGEMKGLDINISLDDVIVKGEDLEVKYTYTATYKDTFGRIVITGWLQGKEKKDFAKKVKDAWEKDKKVPEDYAEQLINMINYTGSANGVLIARVLNLSPPIVPPRIQLGKK